jgi:hypothetical protein
MRTQGALSRIAASAVFLAAACDPPNPTAPALFDQGGVTEKKLSLALCAPGRGGFTVTSTNPYFPMGVGHQLILTGEDNGEAVTLQVTVLNVTRNIEGVTTRVIEEREFVDGELAEVTWNYHVQAVDGTNCYYGEDVDVYEAGGVVHEGAWCPGGGNQPGIFMPAEPAPGMNYQNEVAPGIALDEATIVGIGPFEVPFGRFAETIRIREFDPLTGDKDHKIHAAGFGIIVDGPLQLVGINQTTGAPPLPTLTVQSCGQ